MKNQLFARKICLIVLIRPTIFFLAAVLRLRFINDYILTKSLKHACIKSPQIYCRFQQSLLTLAQNQGGGSSTMMQRFRVGKTLSGVKLSFTISKSVYRVSLCNHFDYTSGSHILKYAKSSVHSGTTTRTEFSEVLVKLCYFGRWGVETQGICIRKNTSSTDTPTARTFSH